MGLVWAGNPENARDESRSTHLQSYDAFLLDESLRGHVRFFSLQVGARASEVQEARYVGVVEDLSPELSATADTAGAVLEMDLVITIDTFVAHLAGTLGVAVWLLLGYAPDWRWLLAREDSPWYPSMRLFRQRAAGDWSAVAARVWDELRRLPGDRSGTRYSVDC